MTNPNPQLIQQAIRETTETKIIAEAGDFGFLASATRTFLNDGALANA
ncbi:hypothetical protein SDC9_119205 [bioreactor metagenome]|uniref:Uncharacterized protein n=1 Tax=bioreactor metagenome TaxID=1076179 RepID=A0A645C3J8_9ZZZZ